jgi:hypothetical protein
MPKLLGFGCDTMGGSPYIRRLALGASTDLNPSALSTPYDLNVPGRVLEVKRALAAVGGYDRGKETLWRLLSPDDTWDDSAEDEYVIFVSRWKDRLKCYPFPMLTFSMGAVHPTFSGLLMLDAAYRYAAGGVVQDVLNVFTLRGCDTGSPSAGAMPMLETFLAGTPQSEKNAILLLRKGAELVKVTPSGALSHPVPPPDIDADLFAQYTSVDQSMKEIWTSLAKAVTDDARVLSVQALDQARRQRDDVTRQILAKAGTRTGTTEVENVGRCDAGLVWDKTVGKCVPPVTPPPGQAAITPGGWALIAASAGAIVWALRGKEPRRRARARAYR